MVKIMESSRLRHIACLKNIKLWLSYINDDEDSTDTQANGDTESKCHAGVENNEEEKIEVIITILRSKTKPANEALETNEESPGFYKQII